MKSLRLCPIAFTHPDETQSLAGIGPSIAATLVLSSSSLRYETAADDSA